MAQCTDVIGNRLVPLDARQQVRCSEDKIGLPPLSCSQHLLQKRHHLDLNSEFLCMQAEAEKKVC